MYVVTSHITHQYFHSIALADHANQFSCSQSDFSYYHRFAIFCNPDQVILDIIRTMGRFSVILHIFASGLVSLLSFLLNLKLGVLPEGKGFNPLRNCQKITFKLGVDNIVPFSKCFHREKC